MSKKKKKLMLPVPVVNQQEQQDLKHEPIQDEQSIKTAKTLKFIPLYRVIYIDNRTQLSQQSEKLIVKVVLDEKQNKFVIIVYSGKNFLDKRTFKTATGKHIVDISFEIDDFKAFYKSLIENAVFKEVYSCPGYQNGIFAYINGLYIPEKDYFKENIKLDETQDYNCLANELVDVNNSCRPMLYRMQKDVKVIIKEFFNEFVKIFDDPAVLICVGTSICGNAFWDIFKDIAEGCCQVIFSGQSQSGKSTILLVIASIFGLVNTSAFMSGNSTIYAINIELSNRMNIPVLIEELILETMGKLENFIKSAYTGVGRIRGKKDGLEKTSIHTAFVATTNSFFPKISTELLSRIVFSITRKGQFDLSRFSYFDVEKRKELSKILPELLKYRPKIESIYNKVYKELDRLISEKGRHISNLAVACTFWDIVNDMLGQELVDWRKIAVEYNEIYQEYLKSEIKQSDSILNEIARMIDSFKLEYNKDFILVKKSSLRLNVSRFIEKYNTNNPSMLMNKELFKLIVQNDTRFDLSPKVSKGCGRNISIDVSENPALLEILEHLRTQNKPIVSNNAKNTASCNDVLASLGINIDDTTITAPVSVDDIINSLDTKDIDKNENK